MALLLKVGMSCSRSVSEVRGHPEFKVRGAGGGPRSSPAVDDGVPGVRPRNGSIMCGPGDEGV